MSGKHKYVCACATFCNSLLKTVFWVQNALNYVCSAGGACSAAPNFLFKLKIYF